MPQVGSKHFPYTPAGQAAAKKAAKKTGQPMKSAKSAPKPMGPPTFVVGVGVPKKRKGY